MRILQLVLFILLFSFKIFAQSTTSVSGFVNHGEKCVPQALIGIKELNKSTRTDANGSFELTNIPSGNYHLIIDAIDFLRIDTIIAVSGSQALLNFQLTAKEQIITEVVVSGSLREVSKLESIVPVEIYSPKFFAKNPSSNLMECMQNINGIRPQTNCNICNTGDIHINGLEGPYTMVLIDGMPIVSSLSTVYGLSGIPSSLIERIEIIRGPASTIYGSEAIGGVINVITKKASVAPQFSADVFTNSWLETNADLGVKFRLGKKINVLNGINYFNYSTPIDNNNDGFTDLTLQQRISVFQKWQIERKDNKDFSIAARYFYEDRWGGEMNWDKQFRGSDSIYGESIYTSRWEVLGKYQLPLKENFVVSISANNHTQNSFYGTTSFMANQHMFFGQLAYYKTLGKHDLLVGSSIRSTNYDDNTFATLSEDSLTNIPFKSNIPGVFIQDEWNITEHQKLMGGIRWDYNSYHGSIFTPRIGYKLNFTSNQFIRLNAGTGYRVVNLFTEDHAALTGARKVEIINELLPEQSYNANINYYNTITTKNNRTLIIDASCFYTYFTNKIVADYLTDPNKIIYDNLSGYAESIGASLNLEARLNNGFTAIAGGTLMDVSTTENGKKQQQLLSERFTGTWTISYFVKRWNLDIDYTGNVYSPMQLPVLGELDPRSSVSEWWSIQNIKFTYKGIKNFEIYAGIKNLLNWTPGKNQAFIIARANDPFDKNVQFNTDGTVMATASNPYALTFDPNYVYGPNQGIRGFVGVKYVLR